MITIGKYRLYWDDNDANGDHFLWIDIIKGDCEGEGGVFDESELEKVIEKFYLKNF